MTREEAPGGPLSEALGARGFTPLHRPVLRTRTLVEAGAAAELRSALASHRWLLVTSPRTVRVLDEAGFFRGGPPRRLRIGTAGRATADALAQVGWTAELVPSKAGAAGLLEALHGVQEGPGEHASALIPGSARALPELPLGLEARGWRVTSAPVYDVTPVEGPDPWWSALQPEPDLVLTFCSPSAVEGVDAARPPRTPDPLREETLVGVQGPTTARAARAAGWHRVVEAQPRTFAGLADELARLRGPGTRGAVAGSPAGESAAQAQR